MGAAEQNIVKQAYRFNQPLPDRIKNAPALTLGLSLYLDAFFELDSERGGEMSPKPIPRSEIIKYAERYGFSFDDTEDFLYIIRTIDNAHLKRLRSKIAEKSDKTKPS